MAREQRRSAAGRDAAGFGPHLREGMHLAPLKELDGYRLADGEPDIRGWPVQTLSGRKIGEVDDMLVDEATGEVVLLDVDLEGTKRRTLAPVRAVQLNRERRIVLIDSIELRDAEQLPTLARTGDVTAEELRLFRDNYAQLYGPRAFHEERDYDIRRREQSVRLSSQDADVSELERADDLERANAVEQAGALDRVREREIERTRAVERAADLPGAARDVRYPQHADERVVEQRPVVMEEVVVRRRVVDPSEAGEPTEGDRRP